MYALSALTHTRQAIEYYAVISSESEAVVKSVIESRDINSLRIIFCDLFDSADVLMIITDAKTDKIYFAQQMRLKNDIFADRGLFDRMTELVVKGWMYDAIKRHRDSQ